MAGTEKVAFRKDCKFMSMPEFLNYNTGIDLKGG